MRRVIVGMVAMLFALSLAACAGIRPSAAVKLPVLQLEPASLPEPLALQQQLHFSFGRQQRELSALVEADQQQVQLAVEAMGQVGVRLKWDGQHLTQVRAPWLPPQVHAERVLDDLQFALWPVDAIAHVLPRDWSVVDDGHVRNLLHEGQIWLQLRRQEDGSLFLENRADGYTMGIESIDMRALGN